MRTFRTSAGSLATDGVCRFKVTVVSCDAGPGDTGFGRQRRACDWISSAFNLVYGDFASLGTITPKSTPAVVQRRFRRPFWHHRNSEIGAIDSSRESVITLKLYFLRSFTRYSVHQGRRMKTILTLLLIVGAVVSAGWVLLATQPGNLSGNSADVITPLRLRVPTSPAMYHGVYPGGESGADGEITPSDVSDYERIVGGHRVAWVYFSNNWFRDRKFPVATASWIRDRGSLPFVRLMLRSAIDVPGVADPEYSPTAILDGKLDEDLRAWARAAREFGTPVIAEYGTEVNGEWFGWNGRWNGGKKLDGFGDTLRPDGPERFAAAYRHIVTLMRSEGANNVAWVFHVNGIDVPNESWNAFENYFPGNDIIDWVGLSCYGYHSPADTYEAMPFIDVMDRCIPRLQALAPGKPVMLFEFGCTSGHARTTPDAWVEPGLKALFENRWPSVAGICWWNERWTRDGDPAHDSNMRLQDNPALRALFREQFRNAGERLVTRPL